MGLLTLKDKIIQLRHKYVPSSNKNEPEWGKKGKLAINQELRQAIKDKRRHHRKWIKSTKNRREECKERNNYVAARNKVNRLMTRAKRDFEKSVCQDSRNNPKRFWKHIRSCLKTKPGISPLLQSTNDETSVCFKDEDKADILQNQFSSVFTEEPQGDLPDFPSQTDTKVELKLSIEMIRKEILSINPNKSIGPDEVHPVMLKELVDYVSPPLFLVMSKSLAEGKLPTDWRLVHVTPIYKRGPKNIAENYRPVSLTSIACRLMEKIIKEQILSHLVKEEVLSKQQHGFMKNRSTVTQLLSYLDKCAESI